jgi:hypothetical protein
LSGAKAGCRFDRTDFFPDFAPLNPGYCYRCGDPAWLRLAAAFARRLIMSKLACIFTFAVPLALSAVPATAQTPIPDLRGTWKGESETLVLKGGNPHHPAAQSNEPELRSVAFTLVVDKQEGRRFSGTFSSARSSEKVIAVISRGGTILLADDEGYTYGTMLAPNRLELCYLHVSSAARVASCTELIKQP